MLIVKAASVADARDCHDMGDVINIVSYLILTDSDAPNPFRHNLEASYRAWIVCQRWDVGGNPFRNNRI